jgi:hypothetical protein
VRRSSPVVAACLLAGGLIAGSVLAGCGGSSSSQSTAPANTEVNPGPNSTLRDPGPNNTANGPQTLQGTLRAREGCIELDGNAANEPAARFQLTFASETVTHQGTTVVVSGSDGKRSVGPHDTVFVAGHPGSGHGACGRAFTVDKVVAVTPAP